MINSNFSIFPPKLAYVILNEKSLKNHRNFYKIKLIIYYFVNLEKIIGIFTVLAWILPAIGFHTYLSVFPGHGYQTQNATLGCYAEFMLKFDFRAVVFWIFIIPFVCMIAIYSWILRTLLMTRQQFLRDSTPQPLPLKRKISAIYTACLMSEEFRKIFKLKKKLKFYYQTRGKGI